MSETTAKTGGGSADSLSFEAAMARLEMLVRDLEEGNLSLDQSIRSFEEGMQLVRRCAGELKRAEEQVKRLTEEAGRILVEDLDGLGPLDTARAKRESRASDDEGIPF